MQHKVFRIEQTFAARRAATADARHANERREALGALIERRGVSTDNSLKHELAVVQDLIARHKHELAALINDGQERRMARAAGELGAAVDGMDKATQSILKSAESIDDSAKALAAALKSDYERALAQDIQDHVVQVYEACNFQDLTGQRIGKVIELLCTVEAQLTAMLTHCDDHAVSPGAAAKPAASRGLINGPKLDGDSGHTSQHDIDKMFG